MKILDSVGLSFDDVLLVPQKSTISSRFSGEIDLTTMLVPGISLNYPIISANMDTVTEDSMTVEMENLGGLGIIHRFLKIEDHVELLKKINSNRVLCIGVGKEEFLRFKTIFELVPINAVLIDIAHGHSEVMLKQIKRVREISEIPIIAGNVATYDGVLELLEAGVSSVKAGVGPGCFVAGTKILMANGSYVNIEDIRIGDKVIGGDGKPANVVGTKNSGIRKVISYRHAQFPERCYCTPDHKHFIGDLSSTSWETVQSRGYAKILDKQSKTIPKKSKFKWESIENFDRATLLFPRNISFNLQENFSISIKKRCGGNWKTGSFYKEDAILTPNYDIGYIFGTFLGDGNADCAEFKGSHSGSVHWYFGKGEKDIANKLSISIKKIFGKDVVIKDKDNIIEVVFYYKPLADFLLSFGKKSNKHLPKDLLVSHTEYLQGLYDGFIDSDGNVEPYGRVCFKNTSRELIEQFGIISYILHGFLPSFFREDGSAGGLKGVKNEDCKPSFRARNGTLGVARLTKDYQVVERLEYEDCGLCLETFDIEVDNKDHSFIANNVIVHNSLCTTRIQTGCGVPQLTAIIEARRALEDFCANKALPFKPTIIADGGIRYSGDSVKSFAAGADAVMVGNLFAGTDEAPGEKIRTKKGIEKKYRGMASKDAQENWKGYASSIEGEMTFLPYKGPVKYVFEELITGILSGMSYQNAKTLAELRENAEFIQITSAGYKESLPHGLL